MSEATPAEVARKVVLRARFRRIFLHAAVHGRGAHYRCEECSWTWDEMAPEQHAGWCMFAPFGLAPDWEYAPVPGESR